MPQSPSHALVLDFDAVARMVSTVALAHAIADHTSTRKTTGDLTWVAKACAQMSGSFKEVDQNWTAIRGKHVTYTILYMCQVYLALAEGPAKFKALVGRLEQIRNRQLNLVQEKFEEASSWNAGYVRNAEAGFEAARAVKIFAIGTLALLSGIGGVAGPAAATGSATVATGFMAPTAFGSTITGFSWIQGTLVTVGLKSAIGLSSNWATENSIGAIVLKSAESTAKDTGEAGAQKQVEIASESGFRGVLSYALGMAKVYANAPGELEKLQKRFAGYKTLVGRDGKQAWWVTENLAKQKAQESLIRKGALGVAHRYVASGAAAALNITAAGFPLLWLANDMRSLINDADADAALLNVK